MVRPSLMVDSSGDSFFWTGSERGAICSSRSVVFALMLSATEVRVVRNISKAENSVSASGHGYTHTVRSTVYVFIHGSHRSASRCPSLERIYGSQK